MKWMQMYTKYILALEKVTSRGQW